MHRNVLRSVKTSLFATIRNPQACQSILLLKNKTLKFIVNTMCDYINDDQTCINSIDSQYIHNWMPHRLFIHIGSGTYHRKRMNMWYEVKFVLSRKAINYNICQYEKRAESWWVFIFLRPPKIAQDRQVGNLPPHTRWCRPLEPQELQWVNSIGL